MSTTRETIEAAVQSTGPTTSAALAQYTGIGRSSLNRALNKLATEGRIETLPGASPIEWVVAESPVSKAPKVITAGLGGNKGERGTFKGVLADEDGMHEVNVEDITTGEDSDWIHRASEATKLPDDIEAAFVALEEAYSQKPAVIDDIERKQLVLARLAGTVDPTIATILYQIGDDLLAVSGKQQ